MVKGHKTGYRDKKNTLPIALKEVRFLILTHDSDKYPHNKKDDGTEGDEIYCVHF